MKTSIDTIRESLDKAIRNLSYYDGFDNDQWEKAMEALSIIDPDAKPKESSDEARIMALNIRGGEHELDENGYWRNNWNLSLSQSTALITARDDAIRREYYRMGVEAAIAEWKSLRSTIGREEMIDNVRQVLLGIEPAREES